jgi:hypothetical protein
MEDRRRGGRRDLGIGHCWRRRGGNGCSSQVGQQHGAFAGQEPVGVESKSCERSNQTCAWFISPPLAIFESTDRATKFFGQCWARQPNRLSRLSQSGAQSQKIAGCRFHDQSDNLSVNLIQQLTLFVSVCFKRKTIKHTKLSESTKA